MNSARRLALGLLSLLLILASSAAALMPTAAEGAPPAARTKTSIELTRTSPLEVDTGGSVTLDGKAPKALRGKRLTVEYRLPGSETWAKVGAKKVGEDRTFTVTVRAGGSGTAQWRVRSGKIGKKQTVHVSDPVSALVFSWYYLYDLDSVDSLDFTRGSTSIGGNPYTKSVYGRQYSSGYVEYNLSYRCKTFAASLGLDDDSDTDARYQLVSALDGAAVNHGVFAPGVATAVTRDTRSVFRIKLSYSRTGDYGYPTFGDARVLCAGAP